MIYLATGSMLSGVALGVTARIGARRSDVRLVPRRLHQTAFVTSSALLAVVATASWPGHRIVSISNASALLILTTLPRTSGWRRRHAEVALVATLVHLVGVGAHIRTS